MRNTRWKQLGWLGAIVVLGLLLRAVGLGWESIWYDEADSLVLAAAPWSEHVPGKVLLAGNPTGYFALLRLWCLTFGFSIESARALSVVSGTLAIPCTWLLALRASGRPVVAITASLLVAINPAMVFLSREARVFALMSALITLAVVFLLDIVTRDSKRAWIGLAVVSSIALYLHYNTFFFLAVVPWPILWSGRVHFRKTVGKLLAFYGIVGITFLPWIPTFYNQLVLETSRQVSSWFLHAIYFPVYAIGGRTLVWKQDGAYLVMLTEIIVLFAVLLPLITRGRGAKDFLAVAWSVVLGVPVAAFLVSLTLSPVFNGRYVSFVIPALMVILAEGIQQRSTTNFCKRWLPAALLGLLMVISLFRLYTGKHKDDWRGLAQYVGTHGPQQRVVFYEEVGRIPFGYYRPQQPILRILKNFDSKSQAWKVAGYLSEMKKSRDFWFVISPELSDSQHAEIMNWLETHFEQIDAQRFRGLQLLRYRYPKSSPGENNFRVKSMSEGPKYKVSEIAEGACLIIVSFPDYLPPTSKRMS